MYIYIYIYISGRPAPAGRTDGAPAAALGKCRNAVAESRSRR